MSDLNYLYGIARYHLGLTSKEGKAVIAAADEIEHMQKVIDRVALIRLDLEADNQRLRAALESLRMSAQGQDDGWIIDAVDEALKDD